MVVLYCTVFAMNINICTIFAICWDLQKNRGNAGDGIEYMDIICLAMLVVCITDEVSGSYWYLSR
jgi:hypothetical protein